MAGEACVGAYAGQGGMHTPRGIQISNKKKEIMDRPSGASCIVYYLLQTEHLGLLQALGLGVPYTPELSG